MNTIAENRKKGAAKAAETRREKKRETESRVDVSNVEDSDVCSVCKLIDSPGEDCVVDWISCDGCSVWSHLVCVDVRCENGIPEHWQCLSCSEQWT